MSHLFSLKTKILLFSIFLIISFGCGEIFIRILNWAPPLIDQPYFSYSEDLPYLLTPHYHFTGLNRTKEFYLDDQVNSLGFLDDEWTIEKPEQEKRIVFLGDSFTSGIARAQGVEYTNEVERLLKSLSEENLVNVLNMGVGGFFPKPQRIVLEKYGMLYHPDLVVVNFIANDVLDTARGMETICLGQSGKLRRRHEQALGPVKTWFYLQSHFARRALKIAVLDRLPKKVHQDNFEEAYQIKGRYESAWQKCLEEYQRINKICSQENIPLVLVYLCQPETWTDDYQHIEIYLNSFCQKEGIFFISVREELKNLASHELIYYPLDGHYQDNANRTIAQKVAPILRDMLFSR